MIKSAPKDRMQKGVWSQQGYYHLAHQASLDTNHSGMKMLVTLAETANKILDLGCGEGTRLNLVGRKAKTAIGVDISQTAVKMAQKNYPHLKFSPADLEEIPLPDKSFDLVYSAYVLEHLENPEKVLGEAKRLIRDQGYLLLIAPNFGAPNRASPPFKGSRWKKLAAGFLQDLTPTKDAKTLGWLKVEPIASKSEYDVDWDTTIEPYLGSLIRFLKKQGFTIEHALSCWQEELPNAKIHQRLFKFLGNSLGIYPFWLWGPHLVVVAKNESK